MVLDFFRAIWNVMKWSHGDAWGILEGFKDLEGERNWRQKFISRNGGGQESEGVKLLLVK